MFSKLDKAEPVSHIPDRFIPVDAEIGSQLIYPGMWGGVPPLLNPGAGKTMQGALNTVSAPADHKHEYLTPQEFNQYGRV